MRMTGFQVTNYRSIEDSGWIDVADIAVIVGKNESGKSSLLKALWKFKPYTDESYSLDREWPRGRRKERSPEKPVVRVRFEFNDEERTILGTIDDSTKAITGVDVTRNYKGSYTYNFLPEQPSFSHDLKWVVSVLKDHLSSLPDGLSEHYKANYERGLESFIEQVREKGGSQYAINNKDNLVVDLTNHLHPSEPYRSQDAQYIPDLQARIEAAVKELQIKPPVRRAIDMAHEWLPTFIYMDDHRAFEGTAFIDQIKHRKDSGQLTDEDKTTIMLMEMSGLDLDEEYTKANLPDKEQRMLDMADASRTLTDEIATRWSQKKYEVMFAADGHHFKTFVKDEHTPGLIPLEERSKGFQWFFSFDMMFMYETGGQFDNSIILLDEPGLHLHAAAQEDLLERMRAYAENNQLIYSTHLPFMIDFKRLDNIFVAEETKEGTKVHKDWMSANEDARFTLQAALGLTWSQSLFVGRYNLVVEGVTDFWYLRTISDMLEAEGQKGLDEDLVITPAGGGTKAAYLATLLNGQKLNVAVLLDSDGEGDSAYKQIVHNWIISDKQVLMLGKVLALAHECCIEDVLGEPYYLEQVQLAYQKELGKQSVKLKKHNGPLVEKIALEFEALGLPSFNKGRVGKLIMKDLAKKSLADLPEETVENFGKVIAAINGIVQQWKSANK